MRSAKILILWYYEPGFGLEGWVKEFYKWGTTSILRAHIERNKKEDDSNDDSFQVGLSPCIDHT